MNKEIELAPTVVLIDTIYLNFMLVNLKSFLEDQLNREMASAEMADLLAAIALDAGIEEGEKEIQVFLVYDESISSLTHITPSNLEKELNGVAFQSSLGEFVFSAIPTKELVSREDLYFDLLTIIMDSKDVKQLILLSSDEEYGDRLMKEINKKDLPKELMQFRMRKPTEELHFKWDMLVFPLMKAFGVESNEIG